MIERCTTLLLNKKNGFLKICFLNFLNLTLFCMFGDLNLNLKQEDFSDSFASKLFKRGNIPLIVNQKILSNFEYEDVLPDSLFYQLQFI